MSIDRIRQLNHAVPFRPYEIHRSDGKIADVAHPDFVALAPRGNYVHVINPDDRSETIFMRHIVAVHHATTDDGATEEAGS